MHHLAPLMSEMGQNLRLPQRNIGIRFNPISRHYAHKRAALLGRHREAMRPPHRQPQ